MPQEEKRRKTFDRSLVRDSEVEVVNSKGSYHHSKNGPNKEETDGVNRCKRILRSGQLWGEGCQRVKTYNSERILKRVEDYED